MPPIHFTSQSVMMIVATLFVLLIRQSLEVVVCSEVKRVIEVKQMTEPVMHGEGPHWMAEEQALYFVDISGGAVHRYHPGTKMHTMVQLNGQVAVVIPVKGRKGEFIVGRNRDVQLMKWDGKSNAPSSMKSLFTVENDKMRNRFNDGKADAKGVLWIGTMGEESPNGTVTPNQASLYRSAHTCSMTKMLSPVSISNGIAWSKNSSLMYYIDSPTKRIDVFNYDLPSAEISCRRPFFDLNANHLKGKMVPDGMTIDSDGSLWIALYDGGQVIEVSETGKLMRTVKLPAERVSSVAWGGEDLSTLYVTTIRKGLTPAQLKSQPKAGALFAIKGLGKKGLRAGDEVQPCCGH